MSGAGLDPKTAPTFPMAAKAILGDTELRKNVRHATDVIQVKRARVVAEMPDWQQLREAGKQIRQHTMEHLDFYLEQFEANCTRAGGVVHWARDAEEARRIVVGLVKESGSDEVIKIKSMTTEEIQLNSALEAAGIRPFETDLAELIIQLGEDRPSHIVVPALHKNRQQIREIFRREMNLPELGEKPEDLADAARVFLREKFLRVKTGVSGANFLIAETGGVCVVESEGNGRMCLTLPETLITMDNARTEILGDKESRQTLNCIRCAACQNACPVYRQTGGHAYGSVYAGPIGAILTPQLQEMKHAQSLPYASSLCGACYEVCPVKINIPEVLIHLRNKVVKQNTAGVAGFFDVEAGAMKAMAMIFRSERRFRAAQRLGRVAESPLVRKDSRGERWIGWLPGLLGGWTQARDLREMPKETFRDWWERRSANGN
jgi:L-lactate dehydrogenase complex protein LldF